MGARRGGRRRLRLVPEEGKTPGAGAWRYRR